MSADVEAGGIPPAGAFVRLRPQGADHGVKGVGVDDCGEGRSRIGAAVADCERAAGTLADAQHAPVGDRRVLGGLGERAGEVLSEVGAGLAVALRLAAGPLGDAGERLPVGVCGGGEGFGVEGQLGEAAGGAVVVATLEGGETAGGRLPLVAERLVLALRRLRGLSGLRVLLVALGEVAPASAQIAGCGLGPVAVGVDDVDGVTDPHLGERLEGLGCGPVVLERGAGGGRFGEGVAGRFDDVVGDRRQGHLQRLGGRRRRHRGEQRRVADLADAPGQLNERGGVRGEHAPGEVPQVVVDVGEGRAARGAHPFAELLGGGRGTPGAPQRETVQRACRHPERGDLDRRRRVLAEGEPCPVGDDAAISGATEGEPYVADATAAVGAFAH